MARCPVVRPEIVRLPLKDGDWIDVKKRLNTGEYRAMVTQQYKSDADHFAIDLEQMGLSKVMAYGVEWSFIDFAGKPLPLTVDTVRSIDPDVFREVLEAVETHEDAQETARSAEKNVQSGEPLLPATSPSVVG